MDKRELRIGNYVNIFDVKTKLELFDFSFESDFIFPIEITDNPIEVKPEITDKELIMLLIQQNAELLKNK